MYAADWLNQKHTVFGEVISDADFEAAQAAFEVARAEVIAAEESLKSSKFQVSSARASLKEAKENLNRTTIYAPTNGTVSKLNIEPLKIHEESMVMETSESTINVTGRHDRYNFGQPIFVPGTRVVITIPYTGDPKLWQLKPSRWRSYFPRATIRYPHSSGI